MPPKKLDVHSVVISRFLKRRGWLFLALDKAPAGFSDVRCDAWALIRSVRALFVIFLLSKLALLLNLETPVASLAGALRPLVLVRDGALNSLEEAVFDLENRQDRVLECFTLFLRQYAEMSTPTRFVLLLDAYFSRHANDQGGLKVNNLVILVRCDYLVTLAALQVFCSNTHLFVCTCSHG